MARIRRQYLENKFARVHEAMGWPKGPTFNKETRKCNVGAVALSKAWHGWEIIEIANEAGGQKQLTGWCHPLSAAELDAWMSGVLYAKTGER